MKPAFDIHRVHQTAAFIAAELQTLLDRKNVNSHMNRCIRECPAYDAGLTVGEKVFATLFALNAIQDQVVRDLARLEIRPDEDNAAA